MQYNNLMRLVIREEVDCWLSERDVLNWDIICSLLLLLLFLFAVSPGYYTYILPITTYICAKLGKHE